MLEKPEDAKSDKDNDLEADSINTAGCIEGTENVKKKMNGKGLKLKLTKDLRMKFLIFPLLWILSICKILHLKPFSMTKKVLSFPFREQGTV